MRLYTLATYIKKVKQYIHVMLIASVNVSVAKSVGMSVSVCANVPHAYVNVTLRAIRSVSADLPGKGVRPRIVAIGQLVSMRHSSLGHEPQRHDGLHEVFENDIRHQGLVAANDEFVVGAVEAALVANGSEETEEARLVVGFDSLQQILHLSLTRAGGGEW